MRAIVILNRSAGAGAREPGSLASRLDAALREAGVCPEVRAADAPDLERAAAEAARERPDVVAAAGGDGTVNAVANALAGGDVPLGLLPLGTLNHFARDLGVPEDLEGAARVLARGAVRRVDVGEVNGRVFVNNSSLGIYAEIVRDRDAQRERLGRGKWASMTRATLAALRRLPVVGVRVAVKGRILPRTAPFVFVGNNRYEFRLFRMGARAALDRGELSLYLPARSGRRGLVRLFARALAGRLEQTRDFLFLCEREIWIESSRRSLRVALDGELHRMRAPLRYRIRPRSLPVVSPAPEAVPP